MCGYSYIHHGVEPSKLLQGNGVWTVIFLSAFVVNCMWDCSGIHDILFSHFWNII